MTRKEFTDTINDMVKEYIADGRVAGSDFQIQIDPVNLHAAYADSKALQENIDYSDEVIENAANAQGAEFEERGEHDVARLPDYYALSTLVTTASDGSVIPDTTAIDGLVSNYF